MNRRESLAILAVLLTGLLFIGCGGGSDALTGTLHTTGAALTVTASYDKQTDVNGGLLAGQSVMITATLMDNSINPTTKTPEPKPLPNQVVNFAFTLNNSGATLIPLNGGITSSTGQAFAVYTAGYNHPGIYVTDSVQAKIGTAVGGIVINRIGNARAPSSGYTLTLSAVPATTMTPGDKAVVTATVTDVQTLPAPMRDVVVTFSFVNNKTGATLSVMSGRTDAAGKVVTIYTAGDNMENENVQDAIMATVTDGSGTSSTAVVVIERKPESATGMTITVTAGAKTGTGPWTFDITAKVKRLSDNGNPAIGETVNFNIESGGGTMSSWTVRTDFNGEAKSTFTTPSGSLAGTARIRGSLTDGLSFDEIDVTW